MAGGASGRNGGFLSPARPLPQRRPRQYGAERARAMYARTLDAQRDIFELAAELGADDAFGRWACCAWPCPRRRRSTCANTRAPCGGRLPGRDRRARGPAARVAAQRSRRLPDRPRRRPPPRALVPPAGGRGGAAGARIFEGSPVRGPVPAPDEGPVATRARQRARPTRGRGRRRRAAGARAGVRRTRALAQAAHGRHRAGAADARPPRLRPLGLRVPPAASRWAHPRGRLQRRGRGRLVHGQRCRQPGYLGARRDATCARTSARPEP